MSRLTLSPMRIVPKVPRHLCQFDACLTMRPSEAGVAVHAKVRDDSEQATRHLLRIRPIPGLYLETFMCSD